MSKIEKIPVFIRLNRRPEITILRRFDFILLVLDVGMSVGSALSNRGVSAVVNLSNQTTHLPPLSLSGNGCDSRICDCDAMLESATV